jgi:serine/threonine protein kinase
MMSSDTDPLFELLVEWDASREAGSFLSPTLLCREYPELIEPLKARIAQRLHVERWIEPSNEQVESQEAKKIGLDLSARLPDSIGRYRPVEILGRGGFGTVYLAVDEELQREVAIKVPHAELLFDDKILQLYRREAQALAKLEHPSVVPVYDVGSNDAFPCYVVSKYVHGESLSVRIKDANPVPLIQALGWVTTIAETLAFAHVKGVIHRDVKPANLMIGPREEVYVIDFGLALSLGSRDDLRRFAGTPIYMSPEQARGEAHQVDGRCDIYSLGIVLYELLAGCRPFESNKTCLTLSEFLGNEPRPLRRINRKIPKDVERICMKAISKNVSDRFETADEFASQLRACLQRLDGTHRQVYSSNQLKWIASGTLFVLSCIGLLIVMSIFSQGEQSQVGRSLSALQNALPPDIRGALMRLRELPVETVEKEIDSRIAGANDLNRIRLAYAKAELGRVDSQFLVSQMGSVSLDELPSLMRSLQRSPAKSLMHLNGCFESSIESKDLKRAIQAALASLQLGNATLIKRLADNRHTNDHSPRRDLIENWAAWPLDWEVLSEAAPKWDGSLRSAACLAMAAIPSVVVPVETKQRWTPILLDWYQNASDASTHSASGLTLFYWGIPVPVLKTQIAPDGDRNWYVNSLKLTMIRVPDSKADAKSLMYLGDREVSQMWFLQFLLDNSIPDLDKPDLSCAPHSASVFHPAGNIRWNEAVMFCNWMSRREGLPLCYHRTHTEGESSDGWKLDSTSDGYRLPDEDCWERACLAGEANLTSMNVHAAVFRYAQFREPSAFPCALHFPNQWGFFDMLGNISELCEKRSEWANRPSIPIRGNHFASTEVFLRWSTYIDPAERFEHVGFRVCRSIPISQK